MLVVLTRSLFFQGVDFASDWTSVGIDTPELKRTSHRLLPLPSSAIKGYIYITNSHSLAAASLPASGKPRFSILTPVKDGAASTAPVEAEEPALLGFSTTCAGALPFKP